MKKISLYIMALLTMGLASCSEDFETTTQPLSNPQESILQATDVQFNQADVTTINLTNYKTDDTPITLGTVTVKEGAMPADMKLKAIIQVAKAADFSDAKTIEAEEMDNTNVISILPSRLQDFYINSFTLDPNTTTLYMRTNLYTVIGEESQACIGNPTTSFFGNYTVAFTPYDEGDGVRISQNYYAVVKQQDGNFTEVKCTHSEENVYDDPIFSVKIDALKDNTTKLRIATPYAIVSEDDLAAFKAGDMSVLFGAGEEKGKLAKGGALFIGPDDDGAGQYDITVNMMDLTIIANPVIEIDAYFIYATSGDLKPAEGESGLNYMFYKTGINQFSYTTNWSGYLKMWDYMHVDDTGSTFGSNAKKSDSSESGTLVFGTNKPLTHAGWYTLTITMDKDKETYSFQWTAIDAPTKEYTSISIFANNADIDMKECAGAKHNWYLLKQEFTEETQLKFRANHSTEQQWGGDGSQSINPSVYTLPAGDQNITVPAGKYNIYLNDITGLWSILKIE